MEVLFGENFSLELNKKAVIGGELEVELAGITVEEIEASPDGDSPAGSGATVTLKLKKGETTAEIDLSMLSVGYESKLKIEWEDYNIHLVEAEPEKAILRVEKKFV